MLFIEATHHRSRMSGAMGHNNSNLEYLGYNVRSLISRGQYVAMVMFRFSLSGMIVATITTDDNVYKKKYK